MMSYSHNIIYVLHIHYAKYKHINYKKVRNDIHVCVLVCLHTHLFIYLYIIYALLPVQSVY